MTKKKIKKAYRGANIDYSTENVKKYGGSKVVSGAEQRGTLEGMSEYRKNKIRKRDDVLAEGQVSKAKNEEARLVKEKGRPLTDKEKKNILSSSGGSGKRAKNTLNKGSKFGNFLRSINPFKKKK